MKNLNNPSLYPFVLRLCMTGLVMLAAALLAGSLQASPMNQSQLPMSQHNFQGYVPEERSKDARDENPNLIRLMVHPSLDWAVGRLLDVYQKKNPQISFRIHRGLHSDLLDLLEDNYNFDLLLDGDIADGMQVVEEGSAVKTQVLALGRIALWAPKETVRSTYVLSLRDAPIGLQFERSPYYRAAKEILERKELLQSYRSRLSPVRVGEDLFAKVQEGALPAAFIEYHRLVEAGIQDRREVLKMPAEYHSTLAHSVTLMRKGEGRELVMAFWDFLLSEEADAILAEAGFD